MIEQQNTTHLVPGVNLRSVGTIRDAQKWPKRDKRKDEYKLDQINYNLLSPYTIQKMMKGCKILKDLRKVSGETSETYFYQSTQIKNSSLHNGIKYYETAIHKFLGNSIIKRLEETEFLSNEEIRTRLLPDTEIVNNADWINKFTYVDFMRLVCVHFNVNTMLASEAYARRRENGGLTFLEMGYMPMQAYDFVHLHNV